MRNAKEYNLFIGKTKDGTYLFLEESFSYDYDNKFKGLTGYELEFHTEDESRESLEDFLMDGDSYDCYIEYLKRETSQDVSYDDWCDGEFKNCVSVRASENILFKVPISQKMRKTRWYCCKKLK